MKEETKKREQRTYTREFKDNLVELVVGGERNVTQVAKDFGVPTSTVTNWVRDRGWIGQPGRPASKGHEPASDSEREILALRTRNAELERQVRRLEEDREILKKATAFFAKHHP